MYDHPGQYRADHPAVSQLIDADRSNDISCSIMSIILTTELIPLSLLTFVLTSATLLFKQEITQHLQEGRIRMAMNASFIGMDGGGSGASQPPETRPFPSPHAMAITPSSDHSSASTPRHPPHTVSSPAVMSWYVLHHHWMKPSYKRRVIVTMTVMGIPFAIWVGGSRQFAM